MSHFILLRQRIKVIETIKKTTGAMRLISMSMHSRLRNQKTILETYTNEIKQIEEELRREKPATQPAWPSADRKQSQPVVILIGSQKGLCGAFNEQLFNFLRAEHQLESTDLVLTVGKHATEYIKKNNILPYQSYDQFGASNFVIIANQLTTALLASGTTSVIIFSNKASTFLSQKPRKSTITVHYDLAENSLSNYLNKLKLKSTLLHMLYESLLAEQAARFLSMDMAHRNADEILTKTRLDYNKTRQAYVTRELIELSGGMVAQE